MSSYPAVHVSGPQQQSYYAADPQQLNRAFQMASPTSDSAAVGYGREPSMRRAEDCKLFLPVPFIRRHIETMPQSNFQR